MPEFKIYLGDPYKLEKAGFAAIQAKLKALFKAALGKDANVVVERAMTRQQVLSTQLLVYLVPSHTESVARKFAATEKQKLELGVDGTTAIGQSLVCSEVYVRQKSPSDIALIVAHEALHNKLRLDNVRLHTGKPRGSLAAEETGPQLTPADKELLSRAVKAHSEQWLGGWDSAQSNDPLDGL